MLSVLLRPCLPQSVLDLITLYFSHGRDAQLVSGFLTFHPPPPLYRLFPDPSEEERARMVGEGSIGCLRCSHTLASDVMEGGADQFDDVKKISYLLSRVYLTVYVPTSSSSSSIDSSSPIDSPTIDSSSSSHPPLPLSYTAILVSHGNATDVGGMERFCVDMARGCGVVVCAYDYTGYGRSMERRHYFNKMDRDSNNSCSSDNSERDDHRNGSDGPPCTEYDVYSDIKNAYEFISSSSDGIVNAAISGEEDDQGTVVEVVDEGDGAQVVEDHKVTRSSSSSSPPPPAAPFRKHKLKGIILYGQSVGSGPTCWLASLDPSTGRSPVPFPRRCNETFSPRRVMCAPFKAMCCYCRCLLPPPPGRDVGPNVCVSNLSLISGLILHSPFLSGLRVLTPNRLLADLDVFDNLSRAAHIDAPGRLRVMVIHGTEDEDVPFDQGVTLSEVIGDANTEDWWVQGRGHNDCIDGNEDEFHRRVAKFVKSCEEEGETGDLVKRGDTFSTGSTVCTVSDDGDKQAPGEQDAGMRNNGESFNSF